MAEPNYMAYAQYMGARNPMAEGLNQLGSTLGDIQKNQIERENMKRRNTLADLQMQQGQMQIDDAQAQQGAKQDVYGVTDPRAAYAAEMRARQQAERADRTMKHVERIKAFKAMGATPQFLTEFTKSEMMQDPEMAKMAPFVSFVDDTKMEITKPFKDGELRDPLNPSLFLPAGTYKVIAKASGDPRDPYRFDKIEPVAAEKEQNMTVEQLTSKALKGDKHSQAVLDAMQGREIAKAKANRAIITASGGGGRGGSGGGSARLGKVLPAGQIESISDMMQVKENLIQAGDIAKNKKVTTGPISGRLQSLGSKIGLADEDFTDLQQKLATAENIMLKLRSGAAVTDQEYNRFKREYPTVNDPPNVRAIKLRNTIKYATDLMDEKINLYEESGYRVPGSARSQDSRPPQRSKGGKSRPDPLGIL